MRTPSERSEARTKARKAAKRALCIMLRSWVGIILLASDPCGLRAVLELLSQPDVDPAIQKDIVDLVYDVFTPALVDKASGCGDGAPGSGANGFGRFNLGAPGHRKTQGLPLVGFGVYDDWMRTYNEASSMGGDSTANPHSRGSSRCI